MCRGANIDPAEFEKEEFKELCIRPLVKKFARCKSNSVAVRRLLREYKRVIEVSNLFEIDLKISKFYRYCKGRRITAYKLSIQKDKPQGVTGRGLFGDDEDSDEETYYELEVTGSGNLSDLSDDETIYDESEEGKSEAVLVPKPIKKHINETIQEESSVESLEESNKENQDPVEEGTTRDDRALELGRHVYDIIDHHYEEESVVRFINISLTYDTQSGTFVPTTHARELHAANPGSVQRRLYYF